MSLFLDTLKDEAKAEGLELAEETAKMVVRAMFRALPKAAAASENKWDDMLVPIMAVAEPQIMALLEDINKADNGQQPEA